MFKLRTESLVVFLEGIPLYLTLRKFSVFVRQLSIGSESYEITAHEQKHVSTCHVPASSSPPSNHEAAEPLKFRVVIAWAGSPIEPRDRFLELRSGLGEDRPVVGLSVSLAMTR